MKALMLALLLPSAGAASVTLMAGQTGALGAQKVTLLRVRDSRCPQGVQCITAGELVAAVFLHASAGKRPQFLELTFPERPNTPRTALRITGAAERRPGDRRPVAVSLSDERR